MLHSFHLAELPAPLAVRTLVHRPTRDLVGGLDHAECMSLMQLGAPTVSPARMQLRRLAMFAQWVDGAALEAFLADHPLGRCLARGWHVRLAFLRQWGNLAALPGLSGRGHRTDTREPVVAVTIARTRLVELPRFLRWGKPVERLVRDHPAVTFATAAVRPPSTVSTFSVWRTAEDMVDMVHGRGEQPAPERHRAAMAERRRRDFHHEFTTLRFRPVSEHGTWAGRTDIVPGVEPGPVPD